MDYAPPRIFMDERVFSGILYDAMGTLQPKSMGILIGERYEVNNENFINIVSSEPIDDKGDPFPFLFREEDYLEANGSQKLTISQSVVVGWYRVGNGEGITDDEVVTHRGFFKFPWQLMLKVDREKKEYSLYRPSEGGFELVDLLLYNDQFKGFFTGEGVPEGGKAPTSILTEKYSGSIRRARKIIRELERELGRKDAELAEMRESVRSELSSKIGKLEGELKVERDKVQSLRSIVMKETDAPQVSLPLPAALPPVEGRSWRKSFIATAASIAVLTVGVAIILFEPSPAMGGNRPVAALPLGKEEPKPAVEAPAAPAPHKVRYKVKEGDTLWVISRKVLGDGARFPEIARENSIQGSRRLKPGTVLTITVKR